ncbi:hypothetical protein CRUP_009087 [Coryphaenoides rupestris]|nr:hypothetical protein CRUP_009087 [Coryphaenoides rupestris]
MAPDSYDARQHTKRKEISSRSWFSGPSAAPAPGPRGAPGSLLHKLSLQGKGAAMNKALGPSPAITSTASSPLIRRRTATAATTTANTTANTTRRYSDPGPTHPENGAAPQQDEVEEEEEDPNTESRHKVAEEHNRKSEGAQGSSAAVAAAARAEDCGKSPGGVASLVADYSDSDSSSVE